MRWHFCARTDVGRTRERNEDNFLVFETCNHRGEGRGPSSLPANGVIGSQTKEPLATEVPSGLLVVADGMGGHANGNVASLSAVSTLREWYEKRAPYAADLDRHKVETEALMDLAHAIGRANIEIFRKNRGAFSIEGMGTTIVALLCFHRYVVTACVGDSRIYLLRDGTLKQVTKDHSLIEELIRYNIIGEQDVFLNPNKNIITRALGMNETVEVDTQLLDTKPGDVWLLCSDGLTDMVEDKWIESTLAELDDPNNDLLSATNHLVDLANERGGIDNITVMLGRCSESKTP